jgi:hypothetical protein
MACKKYMRPHVNEAGSRRTVVKVLMLALQEAVRHIQARSQLPAGSEKHTCMSQAAETVSDTLDLARH